MASSWEVRLCFATLCACATVTGAGIEGAAARTASTALAGIASAVMSSRLIKCKVLLVLFVAASLQPCAGEHVGNVGAGAAGQCASPTDVLGGIRDAGGLTRLVSDRPVLGAVMGTSFGWFMTALGAATVGIVKHPAFEGSLQKFLDACLGVAAGVMLAASYWSLLAPALEMAVEDGYGNFAFLPVGAGFLAGGAMLHLTDVLLSRYGASLQGLELYKAALSATPQTAEAGPKGGLPRLQSAEGAKRAEHAQLRVRRMLQLVIAITAHNAPEGLAVGVAFGALGRKSGAKAAAGLGGAISLALGIGIQNFPEGLAVSLPLYREGASLKTAFLYGQMSGVVEPIAGLIGALFVTYCRPVLPFAMSCAAGAMVHVVADSLIPEMHANGNRVLATQGVLFGFVMMMTLDVALG